MTNLTIKEIKDLSTRHSEIIVEEQFTLLCIAIDNVITFAAEGGECTASITITLTPHSSIVINLILLEYADFKPVKKFTPTNELILTFKW